MSPTPIICRSCGTTARVAKVTTDLTCPVCKTGAHLDLHEEALEVQASLPVPMKMSLNTGGSTTVTYHQVGTTAAYDDPSGPMALLPAGTPDQDQDAALVDPLRPVHVTVPKGSAPYSQRALSSRKTAGWYVYQGSADPQVVSGPYDTPQAARAAIPNGDMATYFVGGEVQSDFDSVAYERAMTASRKQAAEDYVTDPVGGGHFWAESYQEALQAAKDWIPQMKKFVRPEAWTDGVVLDLFGLGQGYRAYKADDWTPKSGGLLPWESAPPGVIVARVSPDGVVTEGLSQKMGVRQASRKERLASLRRSQMRGSRMSGKQTSLNVASPVVKKRAAIVRRVLAANPHLDRRSAVVVAQRVLAHYPGVVAQASSTERTAGLNRDQVIEQAAQNDIDLTPADFGGTYEDPTIDGMDAGEWLDAMTMD